MDSSVSLHGTNRQKGGRHLFQVLSQIKDSVLKNKFNLAWEMASKHYQQNKTSLSNQQIYQLCYQSCLAIGKKIQYRMTVKNKRHVAQVTSSHIQHVFSLELSLHRIILPQVIRLDTGYFNMLDKQTQEADPKTVSAEDVVFERKIAQNFIGPDKVFKETKKLIKQHLKISLSVLMYSSSQKYPRPNIQGLVKSIQDIFNKFHEHEFPTEFLDFELIKLSIVEEMGPREGIKHEYRLPIGFLNKIYSLIRKKREEKLDHYLKKLTSYFVLSFKLSTISIENVYIACMEAQHISNLVNQFFNSEENGTNAETKKSGKKSIKRQITIDSASAETLKYSRFSKKMDATDPTSKATEKKLQSKKKILQTENRLNQLVQLASKLIEKHIRGRKQLNKIIEVYFSVSLLKKAIALKERQSFCEEYIQNKVDLNRKVKGAKKSENYHNKDSQSKITSSVKNKNTTSGSLFVHAKARSKTLNIQFEKQERLKLQSKKKERQKFIMKNIDNISKPKRADPANIESLRKLVDSLGETRFTLMDESSSDEQGSQCHDFETSRRKKIQQFKDRVISTENKNKKSIEKKQHNSHSMKGLKNDHQIRGDDDFKDIRLLDDIIASEVEQALQLPCLKNHKGVICQRYMAEKLTNLSQEVLNLNEERKLLVESLSMRKKQFQKYIDSDLSMFQGMGKKQNEQLEQMVGTFKKNLTQHIKKSKQLLNLSKGSNFPLPYTNINKSEKATLKINMKLPELTLEDMHQEYKKMEKRLDEQNGQNVMSMRYQFDKLRRDISKNQFASLNKRKSHFSSQKEEKCRTILELTYQDEDGRIQG